MNRFMTLSAIMVLTTSTHSFAETFTLTSNDIAHNTFMTKAQEFNGFGCSGDDVSPHLTWLHAPKGTKSFAITVHDADAPTGSGWWHWQVVNIPSNVTEFMTGDGNDKNKVSPYGSLQLKNDYGHRGFGGACPPVGHGIHHYKFTVHALSVDTLDLPDNPSSALVGYMINANSLASSTLVALYKR